MPPKTPDNNPDAYQDLGKLFIGDHPPSVDPDTFIGDSSHAVEDRFIGPGLKPTENQTNAKRRPKGTVLIEGRPVRVVKHNPDDYKDPATNIQKPKQRGGNTPA